MLFEMGQVRLVSLRIINPLLANINNTYLSFVCENKSFQNNNKTGHRKWPCFPFLHIAFGVPRIWLVERQPSPQRAATCSFG